MFFESAVQAIQAPNETSPVSESVTAMRHRSMSDVMLFALPFVALAT